MNWEHGENEKSSENPEKYFFQYENRPCKERWKKLELVSMEKRWVKENFKIAISFSIKSVYFVTKVIHVYCRKLRKYILAKNYQYVHSHHSPMMKKFVPIEYPTVNMGLIPLRILSIFIFNIHLLILQLKWHLVAIFI